MEICNENSSCIFYTDIICYDCLARDREMMSYSQEQIREIDVNTGKVVD